MIRFKVDKIRQLTKAIRDNSIKLVLPDSQSRQCVARSQIFGKRAIERVVGKNENTKQAGGAQVHWNRSRELVRSEVYRPEAVVVQKRDRAMEAILISGEILEVGEVIKRGDGTCEEVRGEVEDGKVLEIGNRDMDGATKFEVRESETGNEVARAFNSCPIARIGRCSVPKRAIAFELRTEIFQDGLIKCYCCPNAEQNRASSKKTSVRAHFLLLLT